MQMKLSTAIKIAFGNGLNVVINVADRHAVAFHFLHWSQLLQN